MIILHQFLQHYWMKGLLVVLVSLKLALYPRCLIFVLYVKFYCTSAGNLDGCWKTGKFVFHVQNSYLNQTLKHTQIIVKRSYSSSLSGLKHAANILNILLRDMQNFSAVTVQTLHTLM